MVEIPDTSDVTDSAFTSAKAAGGALIGSQIGRQVLGPGLGDAVGGVGGALATGKSAENKAAATMMMFTVLPSLMNGTGLGGLAGGNSQQASSGTQTL